MGLSQHWIMTLFVNIACHFDFSARKHIVLSMNPSYRYMLYWVFIRYFTNFWRDGLGPYTAHFTEKDSRFTSFGIQDQPLVQWMMDWVILSGLWIHSVCAGSDATNCTRFVLLHNPSACVWTDVFRAVIWNVPIENMERGHAGGTPWAGRSCCWATETPWVFVAVSSISGDYEFATLKPITRC